MSTEPTKAAILARMRRTGENWTAARVGILKGKPEPARKPKPLKPAGNQYQQAIRERQARTGESYADARRAWLEEAGLPLTTATSRVTAHRRQRREAEIAAEYGPHLGIDGLPAADPATRVPPQRDEPKVEYRRRGRLHGAQEAPRP